MSNQKNISWYYISRYKKLSNRKKKLLTNDFLMTFKNELIEVFSKDYEDLTNATYWSFYSWVEESCGFDEALRNACRKHNLTRAIYEYQRRMAWYESDRFAGDLTLFMVERGVIEEGENADPFESPKIGNDTLRYKLVERHKGYNVVKFDWCFKDEVEFIESLYKEDRRELIWL